MAQNLLDPDTFNGNNADTLTTYSANWVLLATDGNALMIRGTPGVGANSNTGQELRNGFTWTNDHWAELKIDGTTVADTRLLVGVRCTQGDHLTATGYWAGVNRDLTGGTYEIYRFEGTGTYTLLQSGTHTYAANDVVNFQAVGTVLTLQLNGSGTEATYDTSGDATKYSTGSPAMMLGHSSTARLAGTWNAGSVGGGGVTVHTFGLLGVGN